MPPKQQTDTAAVRIFPPLVPLVTVLFGVGLDWLVPIGPGFGLGLPARIVIGGSIIVGSLLLLGLWSVVLFRRSGENENPWKPTFQIVARGPFKVTRNPMYLQMVLVCVGFAILLWNVWILLLTPVCAFLLQALAIKPEEAYLERKFGDAYRDYKSRVRRWI